MKFALAVLLVAISLVGCKNIPDTKPRSFTEHADEPPTVADIDRNEGYAILYELLNDESQVAELFVIKSASEPVKAVINDIQAAAKDGVTMLKNMATNDGFINLTETGLPNIAKQTRERIIWATTGQLLLASGKNFELQLLITQLKAAHYAQYLADAMAAAEDNKDYRKQLKDLADRFGKLNQRVEALLTVKAADVDESGK